MLSFADSTRPDRDVVVTGIGLVTPLAISREASWQRLLAGASAGRQLCGGEIDHAYQLAELTGMPPMGAPVNHAEVCRRLRASGLLQHTAPTLAAVWLAEPVVAMSLLALAEALSDAGLKLPLAEPFRSGCCFGASKGGLRTVQRLLSPPPFCAPEAEFSAHRDTSERAERTGRETAGAVYRNRVEPLASAQKSASDSAAFASDSADVAGAHWWSGMQTDSATRAISSVIAPRGSLTCPVAACATGLVSVLQAAATIHSGQCDICVAGSSDASLRAAVLASFHRLRVTSRHQSPATACRPFDQHRDGFLVGEGAAVLILESRSHAAARGVPAWARVTAGGWVSDPTGMTQIDPSGVVVAELLRRTLSCTHPLRDVRDAINSWSVDVINAHGTATQSNDLAEARGIRAAFGDGVPLCFGTKGATGHLLGAAAGVETAFALMALRDDYIPGTTGLTIPDSRFRIPFVQGSGVRRTLQRAVKVSLGFGGHVACGVFDTEPGRSELRSRRR